jgi:hypothetical protein
MSARNDGGSAFPMSASAYSGGHSGMSLRDWLAGQALAGILALGNVAAVTAQHEASITEAAYGYADAMLAERKRNPDVAPSDFLEVEPSDAERAAWPDQTHAYVESLEALIKQP